MEDKKKMKDGEPRQGESRDPSRDGETDKGNRRMKKTRVEEALVRGLKEALEYERGQKKLKTTQRELPNPENLKKCPPVRSIP